MEQEQLSSARGPQYNVCPTGLARARSAANGEPCVCPSPRLGFQGGCPERTAQQGREADVRASEAACTLKRPLFLAVSSSLATTACDALRSNPRSRFTQSPSTNDDCELRQKLCPMQLHSPPETASATLSSLALPSFATSEPPRILNPRPSVIGKCQARGGKVEVRKEGARGTGDEMRVRRGATNAGATTTTGSVSGLASVRHVTIQVDVMGT